MSFCSLEWIFKFRDSCCDDVCEVVESSAKSLVYCVMTREWPIVGIEENFAARAQSPSMKILVQKHQQNLRRLYGPCAQQRFLMRRRVFWNNAGTTASSERPEH
jgi:hypothetical protein